MRDLISPQATTGFSCGSGIFRLDVSNNLYISGFNNFLLDIKIMAWLSDQSAIPRKRYMRLKETPGTAIGGGADAISDGSYGALGFCLLAPVLQERRDGVDRNRKDGRRVFFRGDLDQRLEIA